MKNHILIIIFLFILLILLLILLLSTYNDKENYDSIAKNINTIENCADITSSLYGTTAFGYNKKNKNCYVSKTPLTRPVIPIHPYHTEYDATDIVCNKTLFMNNQNNIAQDTMIGNRLYNCYNINHRHYDDDTKTKTNNNYYLYYFEKNKPKKLITYQDINKLPITYHNIFNIDWPDTKSELNDLNVKFGQNSTKREVVGQKIINGPTDNIYINWSNKELTNNKLSK